MKMRFRLNTSLPILGTLWMATHSQIGCGTGFTIPSPATTRTRARTTSEQIRVVDAWKYHPLLPFRSATTRLHHNSGSSAINPSAPPVVSDDGATNIGGNAQNDNNSSIDDVSDTRILTAEATASLPQHVSRITTIRCNNLGGAKAKDGSHIEVRMDGHGMEEATDTTPNNMMTMVAVTGETGSGKSLLVSKAADLITGGKVASSLLNGNIPDSIATPEDGNSEEASVEIEMELFRPHLDIARMHLQRAGIDDTALLGDDPARATIALKRKLVQQITAVRRRDGKAGLASATKPRIKSICEINGQSVTLKLLKAISTRLLAVVDAPAASNALSRPKARMAMIDTAVPSKVLVRTSRLRSVYNKAHKQRKALERELARRTLPVSMMSTSQGSGSTDGVDDDQDIELLRHWVDEMDDFETKITAFCASLTSGSSDGSQSSLLTSSLHVLTETSWMDSVLDGDQDDSSDAPFSSTMYQSILDVSDGLKIIDDQISAAEQAYETLASLSSPTSALTQLEKTRDFLVDAAGADDYTNSATTESAENKLIASAEQSHHLLNQVEDALAACARHLDDDTKGLMSLLRDERSACPSTSDEVHGMIAEWNQLARKHGISSYLLPACHATLRQELDGNVHARTLLPKAIQAEEKAKKELEEASKVLSDCRTQIATRLSRSITQRLPMLGMDGSVFEARIDPHAQSCISSSGILGTDGIDFIILHQRDGAVARSSDRSNGSAIDGNVAIAASLDTADPSNPSSAEMDGRGGKIDQVASSGEKARILLAIECEIPGSVGSLCRSSTGRAQKATGRAEAEGDDSKNGAVTPSIPPVAVIYDEIDAHVGGRAAVSLADMLSDQSRACQVVSITHSPSVAAVADVHIVVQKRHSADGGTGATSTTTTEATRVAGSSRLEEVARMASGDLASEEALAFADALIRHGATTRRSKQMDDKSL